MPQASIGAIAEHQTLLFIEDRNRCRQLVERAHVIDHLLFKIPSLRNVEVTYPYMHDGRMKSLTEVLKFYSNTTLNLPKALGGGKHSIALNSKERVDVVAFLMTLTDPAFLHHPAFQAPR